MQQDKCREFSCQSLFRVGNVRIFERQFYWSFSVKRILPLPLTFSLDCPANNIKLIVLFKEPRFRNYFKPLTLDSQCWQGQHKVGFSRMSREGANSLFLRDVTSNESRKRYEIFPLNVSLNFSVTYILLILHKIFFRKIIIYWRFVFLAELLLLTRWDAELRVHATGASMIGGGNRGSYGWRQVGMCQWPATCRRRGSSCGTGI